MINPEDKTIPIGDDKLVAFMVGKTIKAVDNGSMNVLNIDFTDGSELMLETEHDKICECGHTYYRHFDTYDYMKAVGCKYCGPACFMFKEQK